MKENKYRAHLIGEPTDIITGTEREQRYFAWPSIAAAKDGSIVVGASGFRKRHIDPYGKAVIAVSRDGGQTYSAPRTVIDTCLDDRDVGLTAFGENGLIVTTFNNSVAFQRKEAINLSDEAERAATLSHLDGISEADEAHDLGSLFRISRDNGRTFGRIYKSPITSPHGPRELHDGRIIWCGSPFYANQDHDFSRGVECYELDPDNGNMTLLGKISAVTDRDGDALLSCEPDVIGLPDGTLVCHIRVQGMKADFSQFTLYQSVSRDGGHTWSEPRQILPDMGGAPAHLMLHSSGLLISVYGYRREPFEIRAIFSSDRGVSWSEPVTLSSGNIYPDMGYPMSAEVRDGVILTAYYCHPAPGEPAIIRQVRWLPEII